MTQSYQIYRLWWLVYFDQPGWEAHLVVGDTQRQVIAYYGAQRGIWSAREDQFVCRSLGVFNGPIEECPFEIDHDPRHPLSELVLGDLEDSDDAG